MDDQNSLWNQQNKTSLEILLNTRLQLLTVSNAILWSSSTLLRDVTIVLILTIGKLQIENESRENLYIEVIAKKLSRISLWLIFVFRIRLCTRLALAIKQPDNLSSVIPILSAMNGGDLNKSVESYLCIYNKIQCDEPTNIMLTNYIVFANFIIPEADQPVFRNVFECISLLVMRQFQISFLEDLIGHSFGSEDIQRFLNLLSNINFLTISSDMLSVKFHENNIFLFEGPLKIPKLLFDEFPCLKYLKTSMSVTQPHDKGLAADIRLDQLYVNNYSWDFIRSILQPLIQILEYNLEAVRSAIAYICYSGCTIVDYVQYYKTTLKNLCEYKRPEIIVQFITAGYLKNRFLNQYRGLALICCLIPELHSKKLEFIGKFAEPAIRFDDNCALLDKKGRVFM